MRTGRRAAWAIAAFALTAAASLALFVTARVMSTRMLAKETRIVTNQLSARLEGCVTSRVEMLSQIRREWELGGLRDDDEFVVRVEALLRTFPGFQAVNRIDADGVIRFVHPQAANAAALGRNLADTPAAAAEWRDAVRTGTPRLSPPLELFQAGTGVTVYVPMTAPGIPPLTLNGVFRTDVIVSACLGEKTADPFALDITDGGERVFRRALGAVDTEHEATERILLFNRTWQLRTTPLASHAAAARDSARLILLNGLPLAAAIGILVFVLLTMRERSRARERAAQQQVERLQRMEALGRMAAGVAHDFNNLLTIVLTSAHILRERGGADPRVIDDIEDASRRGVGLTRQLVAFGRGDEGPMQPLDLAALVSGMRSLLTRLLQPSQTLDLVVPESPVTVLGSKVQFEQILVNLVVNACAAMPNGGKVTVEVGRPDGRVELVVKDVGVGIASDVLPRIYDPFFTTKGDGGSGLGLATVFSHVHRMKGQIEVSSEVGKGTRFAMTFPAHVATAAS